MEKNSQPLNSSPSVKSIHNYFSQNFDKLIENITTISEIPSPSFEEDQKAEFLSNYLKKYDNLLITVDKYKNVIVQYPGNISTNKIAILAHIDTVFPKNTDLKVKKEDDLLIGPGIGDNSASVGSLLHIIEAWIETDFKPEFGILFVFNACEEGLGDLKGVKGLLDDYCSNSSNNVDLKSLISIDGTLERITHIGTGVKRYKIEVHAKGGHSWANFGDNSAIHILGSIIADISKITVPEVPKTTFNVGIIEGGTSVNTIAENASMLVDLRSVSQEELTILDNMIKKAISTNTTNKRDVSVSIKVVGDRPSGKIPPDHPLINIIKQSAKDIELESVPVNSVASTDANIPLSRNIPAVAIGCYSGFGAHTKAETVKINSLKKGVPYVNLAILETINAISKSLI